MGFVKGTDNKARTVKNSLEGQVGDVALDDAIFNTLAVYGNVTFGGSLSANGYRLTSLNAANVSGTVTSATSATSAATANTVVDGAQANITSVGTLTSLSVTGNVTSGNGIINNNLAVLGNVTAVRYSGNGQNLTSSVGIANTSYNVAKQATANIDNISLRVASNGVPQIGTITSNIATYWSGVAVLNTGNSAFTNTGGVANVGVYTDIGNVAISTGGDTITAVIQDQTAGKVYRGTFLQTAGVGNATVIIERLM